MRCRWGALALCLVATTAGADTPVPAPIVYGGMPSGVHVARAETLERGVAVVGVTSGLGYRGGLLGADHSLVRALANVAGAYGVTSELSVGLSLDGYYDRHDGFPSGPSSGCGPTCEQGYVGAPHLHARYAGRVGSAAVGAHVAMWIPGDQVPSMKLGATSVELRGLASLQLGPGTLSLDAGFRLDNTNKTIDDIESLTVPDRVSYGSSNYNAVVAGAHYAVAASPRLWLAGEASMARFVGTPPAGTAGLEDGHLLARLGGSLGFAINPAWTAVAFVDAVRSPGVLDGQAMAYDVPLIPYEPMITAGIGVQARLGGGRPTSPDRIVQPRAEPPCWDTPQGCTSDAQPLFGEVTGTVVDDAGKPLGGATVTITGKVTGATATATTDGDGRYAVANIRIGTRTITPAKGGPMTSDTVDETELEVRIVAEGRDPVVSTISAPKPGQTSVPPITLAQVLPPGQVKGIVRTQSGQPIASATISVTPGDAKAITSKDGTFAIDLAPGVYKVTVSAPGYRAQALDVTIDPNGVALKEFILAR